MIALADGLQIDAFIFLVQDTFPNLLYRLALFGHEVCIVPFFGAGAADCSMSTLKTTMQTGMPQRFVAAAKAGKLVQHFLHVCRIGVDLWLPGDCEVLRLDLLRRQERRQRGSCTWRSRVVRRNIIAWIRPLGRRSNRDDANCQG